MRAEELLTALRTSDVPAIIRLFDGKELYNMVQVLLVEKFGKGATPIPAEQKYRLLREHKDFSDIISKITWLSEMKVKVTKYLELS